VTLGAVCRFYALRRAERVSDIDNNLPWQYETRPSMRMTIGASARAFW
jgi:hypothetical protein